VVSHSYSLCLVILALALAGNACKSGGEPHSKRSAPSGETDPEPAAGAPLYSRFHRLTNSQWENSVHDILKLEGPTGQSAQLLHAVAGTTDFDNNERVVVVGNDNWADFQAAAEAVAASVTVTDEALRAVVDTTDPTTFIETFGRRAFRRELTPDEVASYTARFDEGRELAGGQSTFTKGAALVLSSMFQSPHFLYRTELGDAGKALSGYEMAAKLSLWLRDTTPNDAMLDAAEAGSFDSAEGAVREAKAMLEEPAAVDSMRRMHTQLYKIGLLDTITKDQVEGYSDQLRVELSASARAFFDYIFTQDRGVRDILTTDVAFAGPFLARIYGLSRIDGWEVQQVSLPDRAGWYTQAPYLTQWATNNDPDPIHRGVRLNLDSLCLELGPPAAVLPSVPAIQPNQTNRQRFEALTSGCGGACHNVFINPLGFAFEDYDGLGRYRSTDNGQPVNTTGSYPFQAGTQSFASSAELMSLVAESTEAHECWSKKLTSYALERDVVDADQALVETLGAVSRASGGSLKQVMLALARNDAFRTRVGGAP
jgi:hypothetical protein